MGKDYNENEDDKDSVSDVAGFLPDLVDGGILIDEGGFDVEEVFDKTVDIINAAADDLYDGAETEPNSVWQILTSGLELVVWSSPWFSAFWGSSEFSESSVMSVVGVSSVGLGSESVLSEVSE